MASLMDLTMLLFFACTTSPASVAKELLAAVPLAVALCRAAVCLVATQVLLITTMIVERQVPWVMLLGEHRVWLVLVEMAWIVSVGTVGRILRCLIVLMLHLVGLLIKLHGRAAEFFLCIDVVFVAVAVHAIIKVVFFSWHCRWDLNLSKWCLMLVRTLQGLTVPLVLEWPRVRLPGCSHWHIGCFL